MHNTRKEVYCNFYDFIQFDCHPVCIMFLQNAYFLRPIHTKNNKDNLSNVYSHTKDDIVLFMISVCYSYIIHCFKCSSSLTLAWIG